MNILEFFISIINFLWKNGPGTIMVIAGVTLLILTFRWAKQLLSEHGIIGMILYLIGLAVAMLFVYIFIVGMITVALGFWKVITANIPKIWAAIAEAQAQWPQIKPPE